MRTANCRCQNKASLLTGDRKCSTEIRSMHQTNKRYIPKSKQGVEKEKHFVRNKRKSAGLLREAPPHMAKNAGQCPNK